MKSREKLSIKKKIIYTFIGLFIIANVISAFHAYKFTHFSSDGNDNTKSPSQLSFAEKVKTILLGVSNSKPKSDLIPDKDFKTIRLKSNKEIEIWHIDVPESKGVVLLFHGYNSEKSSLIRNSDYFNQLGYSTILVDFMGCGNSEGNQTTMGYFEAENVKTVFEYAKKNHSNIILYGFSMGAAAITHAISKYHIKPNSIILECSFGSMEQTLKNRFNNMGIPSFPMMYLLGFWGGVINGFWTYNHNPEDYSLDVEQPTLLMYGKNDKNVTFEEISAIYKNLKTKNKHLKVFSTAGHENYLHNSPDEWKSAIDNFLINNASSM